MRAEQYQRQLDAVTDHIYTHLDDDLSLDLLAGVSGFSPYHWHRIYRAVRGETAAQTVRRLRLERAAAMLTGTSWPLERVARRAGFRADGDPAAPRRPTRAGGSQHPGAASSPEGPSPGPVRVEERPELRLAVADHQGSYMDIGRAFARVVDRMGAQGSRVAIYDDDPDAVPEAALRSTAGVVVGPEAEAPEDLRSRAVPAGRYAVMRYTGPYSAMHAAYLRLYGQWLPASGQEPRNHPVVEEYLTDPATTPPTRAVTDILLPLR